MARYPAQCLRATHLADPLPVSTLRDYQALRELNFEIADVNLLRIGFIEESGDDVWRALLQPVRMNYFLFAEPKYMFERDSYEEYEKRLYFYGFKTLWRNDTYRVSASAEGELEGRAHFVLQATFSARLAENPEWDKVQLFVAYEEGLRANHVRSTPYNGLSSERLMVGGRLMF